MSMALFGGAKGLSLQKPLSIDDILVEKSFWEAIGEYIKTHKKQLFLSENTSNTLDEEQLESVQSSLINLWKEKAQSQSSEIANLREQLVNLTGRFEKELASSKQAFTKEKSKNDYLENEVIPGLNSAISKLQKDVSQLLSSSQDKDSKTISKLINDVERIESQLKKGAKASEGNKANLTVKDVIQRLKNLENKKDIPREFYSGYSSYSGNPQDEIAPPPISQQTDFKSIQGTIFYSPPPNKDLFYEGNVLASFDHEHSTYQMKLEARNENLGYYTLVEDKDSLKRAANLPNEYILSAVDVDGDVRQIVDRGFILISVGELRKDGANWRIAKRAKIKIR